MSHPTPMQEYRVVRVPENLGGQEAGYLLSDGRTERTATESALKFPPTPNGKRDPST
jgi:hypothetical protein